jgi:hypothetical protein
VRNAGRVAADSVSARRGAVGSNSVRVCDMMSRNKQCDELRDRA